MNFTRKMKFNIRVIVSFGIQEPFTLCKVNQVTIFIFAIFAGLNLVKSSSFLGSLRDPAGFIKRNGIELNRSAIFLQQPVLNYFKLQFTHTTNDLFISAKLGKQLRNTFIG